MGLSGAYADPDLAPEQKRAIYARSIVHVTNKTLVLDYLRSRLDRDGLDTLARYAATRIGRARAFAIVNEADSILIDEAQTRCDAVVVGGEQVGLVFLDRGG